MSGKEFSSEGEGAILAEYACLLNCLIATLPRGKSPPESTGNVTALNSRYCFAKVS